MSTFFVTILQLDTNKNGFIQLDELKHKITDAGESIGLTNQERKELLADLDGGERKQIDFEDFSFLVGKHFMFFLYVISLL